MEYSKQDRKDMSIGSHDYDKGYNKGFAKGHNDQYKPTGIPSNIGHATKPISCHVDKYEKKSK